MTTFSKPLLTSTTIALTACASNGHSSSTDAGGNHTSAATATDSSSTCRNIGGDRKINNKDQNDGYICKADTVLSSEEAKSILDPDIRVSYGNISGAALASRQVASAVGKNPDEACQCIFLSVVKRLQSTARRRNKHVVQVVSYFSKRTIGSSEYGYHIGIWNSRIVLKSSIS